MLRTLSLTLAVCLLACGVSYAETPQFILLSSTIGPIDAGIVPALEDAFEKETGIRVRHVGAGTGAALDIARRCNVDLVLAHAKSLEDKFVADGFGTRRIPLMYNDFVIVGPEGDPAGIKGMKGATEAFKRMAAKQVLFVTRGDKSGTHVAEMTVWEKAGISYAPSLTVLREMTALRNATAVEHAGTPRLLAMGNPLPGGAPGAGVLAGEDMVPLPGAEEQVKRIGGIYGNRAQVYVGAAANEERFKQDAANYGIIHLATHGILVDSSPMYSHLIMSRAGTEDGQLEAGEILRLKLNADLVVLSACETARGRVGAGEGMIGLSWAFFVVGCPATVVSQWKVDDAATTGLMVEFHRLLQERTSGRRLARADALRQAALKIMREPRYGHPFYWAGFILVGDAR